MTEDGGLVTELATSGTLGSTVVRKEDRRLLVGRGRFVSDLQLPRTRHLMFVRSQFGHAKIGAVKTAEALTVEGVEHVYTGESLGFAGVELRALSGLRGYVETGQPVLACGKVRFAGEAIACVIAKDRYAAEDGAELIDPDYAALPATVCAWEDPVVPVHEEAADNVLVSRVFSGGDVEAGFAEAAVVVDRELFTNRHAGNPMECRAGVALWEDEEHLTFWSGTQIPHLVRNMLAELLDISEGNIRVIAPDVGGGFGVKSVLYPEDIAVCLAARQQPGIPIKWVEDRMEHLQAATHAREHRYLIRAGFAEDGELLAVEADITCNVGAYSVYPWTAGIEPLMAGGLLAGPYKLANYECRVRGVATNTSPAGPYRGVARPATVFAMETMLNDGANALGMSPIEIRRRNLIGPDDVPYTMATRLVDDTGYYSECLDQVLDKLEYDEFLVEQQRRQTAGEHPIGVGFAVYNELTGLGRAASAGPRMSFRTGHEAVNVRINPDGSVTAFSGATSQGQGLDTTLAQVVADAVGVDYHKVEVRIGDTESSLWGFGAFSSRQAVITGGAAHLAGEAARDQALLLAAELLESAPTDLTLRNGIVSVAGCPDKTLTLSEVARVAYLESNRLPAGFDPGLEATRFYDPVMGAFAGGAQAAIIEVNPRTGEITILKWVCVEDPGRILNPQIVEGQVLGSIAQGIGGALFEHLVYDDLGNLTTGTLMDYLMPTSAEMPEFVLGHITRPADNPLGVRGVGEGGTLGPAAVLAGAVENAVGVRIDVLPITPDRLWDALQAMPVGGPPSEMSSS